MKFSGVSWFIALFVGHAFLSTPSNALAVDIDGRTVQGGTNLMVERGLGVEDRNGGGSGHFNPCPFGQHWKNGACACSTGGHHKCGENNSQCCPAGADYIGGSCKCEIKNEVIIGDKCVCPPHYVLAYGKSSPSVTCPVNQIPNGHGGCKCSNPGHHICGDKNEQCCPVGQDFIRGKCRPIPSKSWKRRDISTDQQRFQRTACDKRGMTACTVYRGYKSGSTAGLECVDIMGDIESCGACPDDPLAQDCTSLENSSRVRCVYGKCVVDSCRPGYVRVGVTDCIPINRG